MMKQPANLVALEKKALEAAKEEAAAALIVDLHKLKSDAAAAVALSPIGQSLTKLRAYVDGPLFEGFDEQLVRLNSLSEALGTCEGMLLQKAEDEEDEAVVMMSEVARENPSAWRTSLADELAIWRDALASDGRATRNS